MRIPVASIITGAPALVAAVAAIGGAFDPVARRWRRLRGYLELGATAGPESKTFQIADDLTAQFIREREQDVPTVAEMEIRRVSTVIFWFGLGVGLISTVHLAFSRKALPWWLTMAFVLFEGACFAISFLLQDGVDRPTGSSARLLRRLARTSTSSAPSAEPTAEQRTDSTGAA